MLFEFFTMEIIVFLGLIILAVASTQGCGTQNIQPVFPFIVGGTKAVKGSWPWQANLRGPSKWNPTGYYQFCGGTLISDRFVLTAGHCWYGTKEKDLPTYRIGLGYYHVDGTNDEDSMDNYGVAKLFMHEGYDDRTLANDIALLELDRPVTFSNHVYPACLPSAHIDDANDCAETPVITGWGDTEDTAPEPDFLQQAKVPYITNAVCNQADWYNGEVFDHMFCVGFAEGGIDTCQGDSGGPVVCRASDGAFNVHGITSWGYGCADAKKPGVYTRVFSFRAWIDTIIN